MYNRIQKLLLTEYNDFEETILVESSFAQINPKGIGIAEVILGLTETNFIIAGDFFPPPELTLIKIPTNIVVDPETESMELISVIPLTLLKLKLCARNTRNFIKVILATGRKMYFEFGEHLMRRFYYNIWADRIFTINQTKYIASSTTTSSESNFASITHISVISEGNVEALNKENICILHHDRESNEMDQLLPKIKNKKSSEKIPTLKPWHLPTPKNSVNPDVINLKRRIHQLNHDIQKQLQAVINKDSEESIPILIKNNYSQDQIPTTSNLEAKRKQSIQEIFKRNTKMQDDSTENIWV